VKEEARYMARKINNQPESEENKKGEEPKELTKFVGDVERQWTGRSRF
jgi:hypothetical protein